MKSVFSMLSTIFFVLTSSFSAHAEMCSQEDISMALEAKLAMQICMAQENEQLVNKCYSSVRKIAIGAAAGSLLGGSILMGFAKKLGMALEERISKELWTAFKSRSITRSQQIMVLNALNDAFDGMSAERLRSFASLLKGQNFIGAASGSHDTLWVRTLWRWGSRMAIGAAVTGVAIAGEPMLIDFIGDPDLQKSCMALGEQQDGIKRKDVQYIGANPLQGNWGCGHYLKNKFFNLKLNTQLQILKRSPMTCRLLKEEYQDLIGSESSGVPNWDGGVELSGGSG